MTIADASGAKAKKVDKAEETPVAKAKDDKDAAKGGDDRPGEQSGGKAGAGAGKPGAADQGAGGVANKNQPGKRQDAGQKAGQNAGPKPGQGQGQGQGPGQGHTPSQNQGPGQNRGPGQNQGPGPQRPGGQGPGTQEPGAKGQGVQGQGAQGQGGQRPQGPGQNRGPGGQQRPQGRAQNQGPGQTTGQGQPAGQPQPQPQPQQQPEPEFHVRPTAAPMRPKRRHWFVLLSFVQVVLIPLAVCAWYLYAIAADQYASHLGFSVRTEENNSAIEILGGITDISGSSSSDTDILYSYLSSQELVQKTDDAVDLRAIWSRVPYDKDPIFAFDTDGTIEDLVAHWERKVSIVYDSGTGLIDLRILAFDPEDAKRITEFLLTECSAMINNLSAIAREDAIKYSREELETAVERLKTARRALTEFRNLNQIVDPTIDTQSQMGLLNTLQQQLAEALIELDLLKETARENDPRILQTQRRVEVIENRIEVERRKLGIGSASEGGEAYANLVGEFESLLVDREFAETAYTSAQAAYDSALAEARRQSRYLAAHIRPTLAGKSEFPERGKTLSLIGLILMLVWSISVLLFYSLRDRR